MLCKFTLRRSPQFVVDNYRRFSLSGLFANNSARTKSNSTATRRIPACNIVDATIISCPGSGITIFDLHGKGRFLQLITRPPPPPPLPQSNEASPPPPTTTTATVAASQILIADDNTPADVIIKHILRKPAANKQQQQQQQQPYALITGTYHNLLSTHRSIVRKLSQRFSANNNKHRRRGSNNNNTSLRDAYLQQRSERQALADALNRVLILSSLADNNNNNNNSLTTTTTTTRASNTALNKLIHKLPTNLDTLQRLVGITMKTYNAGAAVDREQMQQQHQHHNAITKEAEAEAEAEEAEEKMRASSSSSSYSVRGTLVSANKFLNSIKSSDQLEKRGIYVPTLGDAIIPSYGVYSPTRQDYLDLLVKALQEQYGSIPQRSLLDDVNTNESLLPSRAMDIGTGTGVIAFILRKLGVKQVVATDANGWALECAQRNLEHLQCLRDRRSGFSFVHCDVYPPPDHNLFGTKFDLIVSNPPWIEVASEDAGTTWSDNSFDDAIFDPNLRFLRKLLHDASTTWLSPDTGKMFIIYGDFRLITSTTDDDAGEEALLSNEEMRRRKMTAWMQAMCAEANLELTATITLPSSSSSQFSSPSRTKHQPKQHRQQKQQQQQQQQHSRTESSNQTEISRSAGRDESSSSSSSPSSLLEVMKRNETLYCFVVNKKKAL